VAVFGAGTMGAQIALHIANAGLSVDLLDVPAPGDDRNAHVQKLFTQATKLSPSPLFTEATARRVRLGNFDDHLDRIAGADWIVEAVVERLDVKQILFAQIEAVASAEAVISSNTSGLPIRAIAEGRSAGFRRRFLGTHFFNPPRYLHLLELVPTDETDPAIVERVAAFGRIHLGKGIVVAKDTPNFIGNRIGIFGLMDAIGAFTSGRYTMEEIDTLTGTIAGRPRSATFRTADVVGLDTLRHVTANLYDGVPDDESREVFAVPPLLSRLIETGALGAKTGAGFYKKEGKEIKSVDPAGGGYASAKPLDLGDLAAIEKQGDLDARLRALYADPGRAGAFFRSTTHRLLAYSARRIPEIADNPADIDRAMEWGFGWEKGPFATWDALGFEAVLAGMEAEGTALPAWIGTMRKAGLSAFYQGDGAAREVYIPGGGYVPDPTPADETVFAEARRRPDGVRWQNPEAALIDLGDGVHLFEFRSKANTLGFRVMQGLVEVIERVENDPDARGLVIGNAGKNFAVGANLAELAGVLSGGAFEAVERAVAGFQEAIRRVRYARKPVVVATHQQVLGGGCELTLASSHPVAAAETYIGLVELGVGLIPAGLGSTHLAWLAAEHAAGGFPSQILAHLQRYFENVAMAKVSSSARNAQELGYLPAHTVVVMNDARRFHAAKATVVQLSEAGYVPPPVRTHIPVLGRPGRAALEVAARQFEAGKFISAYDRHLAVELARVLTGGDLSGPASVHEDYLIALEREVFLRLLGEPKTRERIEGLLKTGKPVRN
jgi:3-hydroxyacyl-CoA dehydrogenase